MGGIVGRDLEASAIDAFLDRSPDRRGALVIEGPPGIGKSTLWLAAVAAARERGYQVLESRPAEGERGLTNVVLGDLFGDVEPHQLRTLQAPRRRAFESALLRSDDNGVPVDPLALGVALVTLLPVLAAGANLLLAIDDDQWMDSSSAAALSFALRRVPGNRVSVVLSRRSPERPPLALEDSIQPESIDRITVGPLSVGALQVLVRERLGAVLARPMQVRLHEVSGGNPFYALELARAYGDRQAVDASAFDMPPSLERLVVARLGALDGETRDVLLLLAAHGRFPFDSVRALSIPPEALDRALRAGVVEIADGLLRFTHPLLASAIYQGAADGERRLAHRRLAPVVPDPVHRARHLALGAAGPDADLAATIEAAAKLGRERGLAIAAAELADSALRLTPPNDIDARRRRAAAAARAHDAAGDRALARAIAAAELADAPAGTARAEALVLASEFETPAGALAMLEQGLAEASAAPRLQAVIHARLAENGYFGLRDRVPFVARHARASLRLAEQLDDDALRVSALSILAIDQFASGRRGALALAERAHRLAAARKDPRLEKDAAWAVGHVLTWTGESDRARAWLERRLAEWNDRDERTRIDFLWYLALVELWAGRWLVAAGYAAEVLRITAEYGVESPFDYFPAALIAQHQGDLSQARSLAARALSMDGEAQALQTYFGILGACDLRSGDAQSAIGQFAHAEQAAGAVGAEDPSMRHWVPDYAEALLQLGHIDQAADLVGGWEAAGRRLGRKRVLAHAVLCRGLIAAARGDLSSAAELLEQAVRLNDAAGDPFGRARSELGLGTARRRARQKRSAREAIEAALAGFEALGAAGWSAAARSELGRIGGRERIAGLSPSELSVATLVAEGRTNREIASTLFLGERTVASHLTHIYSKLGIRSRTELARQFATKVPTS